jgi:hypothetical protein
MQTFAFPETFWKGIPSIPAPGADFLKAAFKARKHKETQTRLGCVHAAAGSEPGQ